MKNSSANTNKKIYISSGITKKSLPKRILDILIPILIVSVIVVVGLHIRKGEFQKKVYVILLQSAYSSVEEGLKTAVALQGDNYIISTPLWNACNIKNINQDINKCEKELKKFFTGVKIVRNNNNINGLISNQKDCKQYVGKHNKWWHLNSNSECSGWNNLTFDFNNGMRADALIIGENDSYIAGQLTIDVNGKQEPNRWGRDVFLFNILKDGSLVAYSGYSDCKKLADYLGENLDSILAQRHWKYADTCSSTTKSDGTACAARIIENGWIMDY